jgi:ABC-type branched-subunit amino acid transport system substrate-binding protein
MAEDTVDQRLARIETALSTLATKADLANVARNVDITALQQRVERVILETQATHSDLRLLTGIANGIAAAVQALVDHQIRLSERVTALETPPQAP